MLAFLRHLARLFPDSRGLLGLAAIIAAAQSALLIPLALLVRRIFDHQIAQHDTNGIVVSSVIMLALYVGSAVLGVLSRRMAARITKNAVARLRYTLLEKLYELPLSWHDRQRVGLVHSTVVFDTERIDLMLGQFANQVLPPLLVALALVPVAIVISPLLFALLLVTAPAMFVSVRVLGSRARTLVREWHAAARAFSASALRSIRAIVLTRVEGAQGWELDRHRRKLAELSELGQRQIWAQGWHAATQSVLAASAGVAVLAVGATSVARGRMTLGELLSFYAILALLLRQINTIVPSVNLAMVGAESLERVEALLGAPDTETYVGSRSLKFTGALEFESVSFGYEAGAPILRDIDLSLRPGEQVTLLGPSGAGKSTLISLLLGLYRPRSGRVLADGVPLDALDIHDLRRQIGVVLQDPILLPGTVRDNIVYGRPDADDDMIAAAVGLATATAFVDRLPHGLDTEIGDEGVGLSGGQRQRVAIARALVGDPAMLVLDEPTTYLEDAAIGELMANLASLPSSPTVLIVTHDLDVAGWADRLVQIRDGRVSEIGRDLRPDRGDTRTTDRVTG